MVVLIAIAAIVIDLGFSWMLHRHEINAVDPAAIAAARWLRDPVTGKPTVNMPAMEADACFYVQQNGFFETDTDCTAALASGDLQVHTPPISGDYVGRTGFVQVIIRASHPLFFGRIFGSDTAEVASAAVAANTDGRRVWLLSARAGPSRLRRGHDPGQRRPRNGRKGHDPTPDRSEYRIAL